MRSAQTLTTRLLNTGAGSALWDRRPAMTGTAVRMLVTLWRALMRQSQERRVIAHLRGMSDAQLRDLGLDRADILRVVRGRPESLG